MCTCMCGRDYTDDFMRGMLSSSKNSIILTSMRRPKCFCSVANVAYLIEAYRHARRQLIEMCMEHCMEDAPMDTSEKNRAVGNSIVACASIPDITSNTEASTELLMLLHDTAALFSEFPQECKINITLSDLIATAEEIHAIYMNNRLVIRLCA